jgi:hypothetical protein
MASPALAGLVLGCSGCTAADELVRAGRPAVALVGSYELLMMIICGTQPAGDVSLVKGQPSASVPAKTWSRPPEPAPGERRRA